MSRERITVTNTAIIVDNYTMGESPTLESYFSIYDPIRHKTFYKGFYYDQETKKLYLPAGMDLWFVRKQLNEKFYHRESHEEFQMIDKISNRFKPKSQEQIEALKFSCALEEYEDNKYLHQLSLNLFTGKGKTYVSIATICFFKIKSIIITASNSLLSQWGDEILKYSSLTPKDIVYISGSDKCNMIINGSSNLAKNGKIFLCSHATIRSFAERYGWNRVGDLFKALGVGMKFYDEAHINFDNMLMIDFFTNTYKTFYVTATPARSNTSENNIFQISLKNVPSIDLFDKENDPHTSYIAIKWNSNPTPDQKSACAHRVYGFDRLKYIDYVVRKPEFYDMMHIIMNMIKNCKGRVLMYIGTNDAILRVYHWIATNYPEYLGDIGIFTSLVDKEQKQKEKKKRLLLSTTKSAGVGEHIDNLKATIVLAEPFKSEVLARQTLGRTRDDNTKYIELVDVGFTYCTSYYKAKLKIFNKYASDVSDTTIDSYELSRRSSILQKERKHYQICPISFADDRFDFSFVKKPEGPICPIEFIDNDNISNILGPGPGRNKR